MIWNLAKRRYRRPDIRHDICRVPVTGPGAGEHWDGLGVGLMIIAARGGGRGGYYWLLLCPNFKLNNSK
jgi:hypothetical protein